MSPIVFFGFLSVACVAILMATFGATARSKTGACRKPPRNPKSEASEPSQESIDHVIEP